MEDVIKMEEKQEDQAKIRTGSKSKNKEGLDKGLHNIIDIIFKVSENHRNPYKTTLRGVKEVN